MEQSESLRILHTAAAGTKKKAATNEWIEDEAKMPRRNNTNKRTQPQHNKC